MNAFHCGVCNKSLESEDHLANHAQFHGGVPLELECPVCSTYFNDRGNLEAHVLMHDDPARIECDECKKLFTRKQGLTSHKVATHAGITYGCAVCGRSFKLGRYLQRHMLRRHTPERMLGCDMCTRRFSRRVDQTHHIQDHTVGSKVVCLCCRAPFDLPSQVLAHGAVCPRRGFVPRPHACTECERTYETRATLSAHMASAHTQVEWGSPETPLPETPPPGCLSDDGADGGTHKMPAASDSLGEELEWDDFADAGPIPVIHHRFLDDLFL